VTTTVQSVEGSSDGFIETVFNSPEKVQSKFIVADGYRTHYLEAGQHDAPPLVLVHGGSNIGNGSYRWYPTIIPLSKHFHVFALDELGFGETDSPRNPADFGHTRVRAEHVIAFIEALQIGPIYLLGQSQGGWIVTYITLTRPDLIKQLIVVDSGSTAGAGLKEKSLDYFELSFEPGTMVPKHDLTTREGIRTFHEVFVYNKAALTEEFLDYLLAMSKKWFTTYRAHKTEVWRDTETGFQKQRDMYSINGTHISDAVENIAVPTLLIWGKQTVKGVDNGIALYKRIPGAQMHIFDRANHFVWLDQPRDFNGLVTWFLRRG
jgi:pimeloyl-ACP methyl ester carboxylesterase